MAEPTAPPSNEIDCQNCGAPVSYLEGEAVLHCSYCGTATMLAGHDKIVRVEAHYVLPSKFQGDQVKSRAREWLSSGFWKAADLGDKATFTGCEGVALPFWVVKNRAQTFWSGMNKRSRTSGSGDNKRTESYWEPTSGEFAEDYNWTVYARENDSEYWGLNALNPGSRAVEADWGKFFLGFGTGSQNSDNSNLLEGAERFSLQKVSDMRVVNGQITQDRAERTGENDIVTLHRRLADSNATRITDCDTTVDIQGVDLVYLPLWFLEYRYRGRTFKLLVNGNNGEIVSGQAPVGKWDKVVMLSILMGSLALVFSAIALLAEAPLWWIGTGSSAGLVGLYALWTGFFSKS